MYSYIYIYIERERERYTHIYNYDHLYHLYAAPTNAKHYWVTGPPGKTPHRDFLRYCHFSSTFLKCPAFSSTFMHFLPMLSNILGNIPGEK